MVDKKKKNQTIKKVGILKLGNIASSILLEMILDERADRTDIDVRTISSGAKLVGESIHNAYELFKDIDFDLQIVATPNAALKAPLRIIKKLHERKIPLIVITDVLKKEVKEEFIESGIGFLIVKADAMIGARREFLDPIEMTLYNSNMLKILATGGVFNILYQEIDDTLTAIIDKKELELPQITITSRRAIKQAGFSNPYAKAKAHAALVIAEQAAKINSEGCFKIKKRLDYLPQVATGHEMIQMAAKLAEEAREIEKSNDKVKRKPHYYDGVIQEKELLHEKPNTKY